MSNKYVKKKTDEVYISKISCSTEETKYLWNLIDKYHKYFSRKDKTYRRLVRALKVTLLILAMLSTVILGLSQIIPINFQVVIGLIISALITFITALSAYFNFEEYWMRNITIHIKLNILRDNFIFDLNVGNLKPQLLHDYKDKLEKIQEENIEYWQKAIKRI